MAHLMTHPLRPAAAPILSGREGTSVTATPIVSIRPASGDSGQRPSEFSLMRMGLAGRLGAAVALAGLVWIAIGWSIA